MNISEYLMTVVSASVIAVISDLICRSYGKSGKGIEKYVKLAVSICVLACVLLPGVKNVELGNLNVALNEKYTANEQESIFVLEKETEENLKEYIFSKTGIKPKAVSINIELKPGGYIEIKDATVEILQGDSASTEQIKEAATEGLGMEVDVIYE